MKRISIFLVALMAVCLLATGELWALWSWRSGGVSEPAVGNVAFVFARSLDRSTESSTIDTECGHAQRSTSSTSRVREARVFRGQVRPTAIRPRPSPATAKSDAAKVRTWPSPAHGWHCVPHVPQPVNCRTSSYPSGRCAQKTPSTRPQTEWRLGWRVAAVRRRIPAWSSAPRAHCQLPATVREW